MGTMKEEKGKHYTSAPARLCQGGKRLYRCYATISTAKYGPLDNTGGAGIKNVKFRKE